MCAIEFLESAIITQLQREHRRFVQKIGARQRVKIVGAANWKGRKKLRHATSPPRHGSDNTCLERRLYSDEAGTRTCIRLVERM